MSREPCISVGYAATPGDGGNIKASAMYTFTWLPAGYGPTAADKMVCVYFDPDGRIEGGLARGQRHPLIEAIASLVEAYLRGGETHYTPPPLEPTEYGINIAKTVIHMAERTELQNVPVKWALDMAHAVIDLAATVELASGPQD